MAKRRKSSKKHRVTVHAAGKKTYKVSGRSPFSSKRGVKIANPSKRKRQAPSKKGFLRSNPGPIKKAFDSNSLVSMLAVGAGVIGAIVLVPKVAGLVPTSMVTAESAKKYQGGVAAVAGLLGRHFVKNQHAKNALLGVAGVGVADLLVKTVASSVVPTGVSLLAGSDDIYMALQGMPEVGADVEVGADFEVGSPIDGVMDELGAGMDYSMAGYDLTM